jgi:hypothetical protein
MRDGVFSVTRGVFDHPIFAREPYTEREAWIWLIGAAVWKDTRARVNNSMFDLTRGQCAFSFRFLAAKWNWSKDKVLRFFRRLKSETMIETQARRDATIITICKYNDYQMTPGHEGDANRDADCDARETLVRRARDKEEYLNKDNNRKLVQPTLNGGELFTIPAKPKRATAKDPTFLEFYSAYPRRQSKQDAIKAYASVLASGVTHEKIMAGLERAKRTDSRFRDPQYTPLPASWLRAGGFDDEPMRRPQDDWQKVVLA